MALTLLPLESRDCPSVWYGGLVWLAGRAVVPFEDWHGGLNTLRVGDALYVGPTGGGAPRVAVLDRGTATRVVPDYWAGDPASRSGVTFVGVDASEPTAPEEWPPITHGPADAFPIYVDFEVQIDQRETMSELHKLLPDVRLTNRRPDGIPRDYGTAVLTDSRLAPYPLAGAAYADWTRDPSPVGVSESVYVDAAYIQSPYDAARMLAHEISHGLKLIPDEV